MAGSEGGAVAAESRAEAQGANGRGVPVDSSATLDAAGATTASVPATADGARHPIADHGGLDEGQADEGENGASRVGTALSNLGFPDSILKSDFVSNLKASLSVSTLTDDGDVDQQDGEDAMPPPSRLDPNPHVSSPLRPKANGTSHVSIATLPQAVHDRDPPEARRRTLHPPSNHKLLHDVVIPPADASQPSSVRSLPISRSPPLSGSHDTAHPALAPPSPHDAAHVRSKHFGGVDEAASGRSVTSGSGSRRSSRRRGKGRKEERRPDGEPGDGQVKPRRSRTGTTSLKDAFKGKLKRLSVKHSQKADTTGSEEEDGSSSSPLTDEEDEVDDEDDEPDDPQRSEAMARRRSTDAERVAKSYRERCSTPPLHKSTRCACDGQHYDAVAADVTYPTTIEKTYSLMYEATDFLTRVWREKEHLSEIEIGEWTPVDGSHDRRKKREVTYSRPLPGSFGPKETKCFITDENVHVDFDDYATTITTTRTPNVPWGSNFVVKTLVCLTFAQGGGTRVLVTTGVEWLKSNRMLKSVIEKSAVTGQRATHKHLAAAIRKYLAQHPQDVIEGFEHWAADGQAEHAGQEDGREGAGSALATTMTPRGVNAVSSTAAHTQTVVDSLGGPLVAGLLAVIAVLLVSNWWTFSAMRFHRARTVDGLGEDGAAIAKALDELERRVRGLKDRVDEVRRGW